MCKQIILDSFKKWNYWKANLLHIMYIYSNVCKQMTGVVISALQGKNRNTVAKN